MKNPLKLAIGSLFVGIVVLIIKYIAYYLTGSVALYSDALESIVNIIAACAVILAVYYSAKPADSKHQYGHYKAEYLSNYRFLNIPPLAANISIIRPGVHTIISAPRLSSA